LSPHFQNKTACARGLPGIPHLTVSRPYHLICLPYGFVSCCLPSYISSRLLTSSARASVFLYFSVFLSFNSVSNYLVLLSSFSCLSKYLSRLFPTYFRCVYLSIHKWLLPHCFAYYFCHPRSFLTLVLSLYHTFSAGSFCSASTSSLFLFPKQYLSSISPYTFPIVLLLMYVYCYRVLLHVSPSFNAFVTHITFVLFFHTVPPNAS